MHTFWALITLGRRIVYPAMKVAYVTIADPADIRAWSGLNHCILRALSNQPGVEVIPVGPLKTLRVMVSKLKTLRARLLPSGGRYLWTRDPALLRTYARKVSRILRDVPCDLIFSPGTEPIAHLETEKPIVCWTDAPFAAMLDYYPWYSNLSSASRSEGMQCDTRALGRCDMAIFGSHWAADAAVSGHRADPARSRHRTESKRLSLGDDCRRMSAACIDGRLAALSETRSFSRQALGARS
jgi:hypothetical protein